MTMLHKVKCSLTISAFSISLAAPAAQTRNLSIILEYPFIPHIQSIPSPHDDTSINSLHPFTFIVQPTNWSLQRRITLVSTHLLHSGQKDLSTRKSEQNIPCEAIQCKFPAALRVSCGSFLCHTLPPSGFLLWLHLLSFRQAHYPAHFSSLHSPSSLHL